MNSTALTVGGLAVGLAILTAHLAPWIRANAKAKRKNWKELGPLAAGVLYGILGGACAGGLLGTVFGWTRSLANWGGDAALEGATGTASPQVTTTGAPSLTVGGALVVLLAFVALAALWKKIPATVQRTVALGAVAGCTVGLSGGIAGTLTSNVIPWANSAGTALIGSFQ